MSAMLKRSALLLSAVLAAGVFAALPSPAEAAIQATIRIDQVSPEKPGVWTMQTSSGTTRTSNDQGVNPESFSYTIDEMGQMILSVDPPEGMSTKISVYRGDVLLRTLNAQQYEFTIFPNDNYRFLIQYSLTKLGQLGITSEPSGLLFRITGPKRLSGKTPKTFMNLPAGRYAIYVGKVEGCYQPAPQTALVTAGGRVTKLITLNCDVAKEEAIPERNAPSRRSLQRAVEARESRPRGERK
jgi:hypothetical protein